MNTVTIKNKNEKYVKYHYSVDDFDIINFFSYTSTIPYTSTIIEVNANNYERYPNFCEKFNDFYYELRKRVAKIWAEKHHGFNYDFCGNKTVFQIRHKFSGEIYFIGRYNSRRAIGYSCHLFDGRIYDFTKMICTDIISDVRTEGYGLWKKFNIEELVKN